MRRMSEEEPMCYLSEWLCVMAIPDGNPNPLESSVKLVPWYHSVYRPQALKAFLEGDCPT